MKHDKIKLRIDDEFGTKIFEQKIRPDKDMNNIFDQIKRKFG